MSKNREEAVPNDVFINLDKKNKLNHLTNYYKKYIEPCLVNTILIEKFIKDYDLKDDIDEISSEICRKMTNNAEEELPLNTEAFNKIITKYQKKTEHIKIQKFIKLLLFYLYRNCFIGLKS